MNDRLMNIYEQDKLAKMDKELHEVDLQLVSPLRNAIRAAELLNIEVPEQYRSLKATLANGSRSQGKFDWSGGLHALQGRGLPRHVATVSGQRR